MKQFYIILAALMLLCLAPMPYGYYMLVRFVAMVVFTIMAYQYYEATKTTAAFVFGVLALLFQPIYKIALGRVTWNVIDVAVAALLVGLFALEKRLEKKTTVSYQQLPPNNQLKLEHNEIEFSLKGRLAPKELVYVASEEDKALSELFEKHPEVLEGWGRMIGFHIIYLPLLLKRLKDERVIRYRAPYLSETELADISIGNDYLLQYLEHLSDKEKIRQGFIRTKDVHKGSDGEDKAVNRFYPLSSKSGESIGDQLHRIGKQISLENGQSGRYLETYQHDNISDDELMEEVRERIAKLRQRGIAEYLLEQLIHPDNRLSRMVITNDGRILLPDYNDMEIKMEPLVKAVYLLFLRHPEGITFKQLPDYREELTRIYTWLRPSGMTERAMQSIEDVTNPMLNSINEKCARIRAAFVGQFDEYMAKSYYIDGARGKIKKIALERDLVNWEEKSLH